MPAEDNNTGLFIEALSNVLENMAFIFTEELPTEKLSINPGEFLAAEMTFHGPNRGRVSLLVQYPFITLLAVNMLGAEEGEVTEAIAFDALKELLNMACGQFLTSRFGSEPVFDLTVPEIRNVEAAKLNHRLLRPGSGILEADEHQLVANVIMEN